MIDGALYVQSLIYMNGVIVEISFGVLLFGLCLGF